MMRRLKLDLPSKREVELMAQQFQDGPWNLSLHTHQLRSLRYRIKHDWLEHKKEGGRLNTYKASDLGITVTIGVDWTAFDDEHKRPVDTQRFAEQYVQQKGGKVLRNYISDIDGYPVVDCEYTLPDRSWNKRVNLVLHRSEYNIVMRVDSMAIYRRIAPLVDAFFGSLEVCLPDLARRTVLNGRVRIGIPRNWGEPIQNEADLAVWEGPPGPSRLCLHYIEDNYYAQLAEDIFSRLPEPLCKNPVIKVGRNEMPEIGVSALYGVLKSTPGTGHEPWSISAIQLPTGLVVGLEFRHYGRLTDRFTNMQLMSTAFLAEVIATVEDARNRSF
jgi:hypothetical protein